MAGSRAPVKERRGAVENGVREQSERAQLKRRGKILRKV